MSEQSTQIAAAPKAEVAVAKKPASLKEWLGSESFKEKIAAALPAHMKPDRFLKVALTATVKNPAIKKCDVASVLQCLVDCSSVGLEPDGRRAHLVPYGTKCTLIIDYKGLVELMYRSGMVERVHADLVCENDEFSYDLGEVKSHKIDFKKPRGTPYAAYCLITLKGGIVKADVMTRDEIEAVRRRSRASGSGPWITDWGEMAKKTVVRRASKYVPLSAEMRDALAREDEDELPVVPESEGKNLFDDDDIPMGESVEVDATEVKK